MKRWARDVAERFNMMLQNGMVTLVGDAAYPMTFYCGQGLNNAIHDVASLSINPREGGLSPDVVSSYEREMCQRGREALTSYTRPTLEILDSPIVWQVGLDIAYPGN
ncbi:hypothetical protein DL771_003034 [Monosporascus sp. 5C6A]|nr:hypothetical protein DL771_003034 [Monosporascus sp. 5C6A]